MEESGTESDLNYVDLLAQEVSLEKNGSMWPTDVFCNILVKILAAFLSLSKEFA